MSNLIPEQRLDRNGRLVTKHVRVSAQQAAGRSILPPPSAGTTKTTKAAQKAYKPLSRQLERQYRSYRLSSSPADDPLSTQKERERNRYNGAHTSFEASDLEMYDVLSATTSTGNALAIMAEGDVRTAKEARSYLKKRKAHELIADRSELMTAAFERGISADAFIEGSEVLTVSEAESPYVLDIVEFKNSALNHSFNAFMLDEIVNGNVAFSDLKHIGFTRLKTNSRAYGLTGLLTKLHRGEADYTIDDIKAFVIRTEGKTNYEIFANAANFAERFGFDLLNDERDFRIVHKESDHFLNPVSSFRRNHDDEDKAYTYQRIAYAVHVMRGVASNQFTGFSTEFFEAGIPVEVAVDVVNGGGGLREAIAIHEGGIQSSVAGGWL